MISYNPPSESTQSIAPLSLACKPHKVTGVELESLGLQTLDKLLVV